MMARLHALGRRWFSDSHVDGAVELNIAVRQFALILGPLLVIGIGIMAVLP
ncbi:hypothetical protein [Sphingobium aromaticiconvertens]|uniref:hypothetical protein n=1 Tax=Sphingobium aromaticiconvertens TaxID=365341 RepID=UPI00301AD4AD